MHLSHLTGQGIMSRIVLYLKMGDTVGADRVYQEGMRCGRDVRNDVISHHPTVKRSSPARPRHLPPRSCCRRSTTRTRRLWRRLPSTRSSPSLTTRCCRAARAAHVMVADCTSGTRPVARQCGAGSSGWRIHQCVAGRKDTKLHTRHAREARPRYRACTHTCRPITLCSADAQGQRAAVDARRAVRQGTRHTR